MQRLSRHGVVGVIVGALVLSACGATETPTAPAGSHAPSTPVASAVASTGPPRGGTLIVGIDQNVVTLDPHKRSAGRDRNEVRAIFDPLVEIDENRNFIPVLAESWETPDDTTWILHLRKGVKFHDGTDFNADAVKYMIERMKNPETGSPRRTELNSVLLVVVDDPYTVTIHLSGPFPGLLASFADSALPISPTAAEKLGDDFARHPVGAGPFEFVEWVDGSHVLLKRFEDYWATDSDGNQLPYLDGLRFEFLTDSSARLAALLTGEANVVAFVPPADVETIKNDPNLVYTENLGPGYNQIYLNTARSPFDNKALRQAMSYAVDRTAIQDIIYLGTGQPGEAPLPPTHPYWDPDFKVYGLTANLEMARQKLAEGGMPDGFEFDFEVFNQPLDIQLAELIAAQLSKVGIIANIVPSDSAALISRLLARDFLTFRASYSGRLDAHPQIGDHFLCDGAANYFSYCEPDVEALLQGGATGTDENVRKEIYREAQRLIIDDAPELVLHYDALGVGLQKAVGGFVAMPDGMLRFKTTYLSE